MVADGERSLFNTEYQELLRRHAVLEANYDAIELERISLKSQLTKVSI